MISFNGWGLTIYDSLSTMAVMNLTSHLSHATAYVSEQLARNTTHPFVVKPDAENKQVPFFETTIRYLGSLLSAYALTKEPGLLAAADKLGTTLLPVFDTPSGLPRWGIDTIT
jgi:mannosyl-oligosaccharide alpha-1,2-mannosidase